MPVNETPMMDSHLSPSLVSGSPFSSPAPSRVSSISLEEIIPQPFKHDKTSESSGIPSHLPFPECAPATVTSCVKSTWSFSEKSEVSPTESYSGTFGYWWNELLWLAFSLVLLAVIMGVLRYFDGRRLPDWPDGISVNTLLAFLAGLCRAAFAWPVMEGISQLKWNWFATGARRLADFETFDEASRGPYASLKLLFSAKGRYV
ncbi:hypothetical protein BX600DRAFT_448307 [Xylariales sp. PMI_506]|nr:hypothetical protein BX600DRAFT_448307 [Xylariales sp. PMI_506]